MRGARVFLALNRIEDIKKLKMFLISEGYDVMSYAQDGAGALRKIRALQPDIVIVDFELTGINGIEIAKIVEESKICPSVIVFSGNQDIILDSEGDYGFSYITRPFSRAAIIQTINLVINHFKRILKLENEIDQLKSTIETRKLIEKAKGIIMDTYGISEKEAFRKLQKQSMDRGISMRDLSQAIITANSIME